jgi:hypothetical protein
MEKITKSVIKLSDIPQHLQQYEVLKEHNVHTYAEFHIDDSEKDELTLWLLSKYPKLKEEISFLIHIDKQTSAVEFFCKELNSWRIKEFGYDSIIGIPQEVFYKAEKIFKEQIINSFMEGADFGEMFNNEGRGFITDAEQYYNRNFKSE